MVTKGDKKESLGVLIRRLREAKHWSQATLAKESGLTRAHIDGIEGSRIERPRAGVLYKLAASLNVSQEDLLVATGAIKPPPREPRARLLIEQLLTVLPLEIPVYVTYPRELGSGEMVGITYRARGVEEAGRRIEAYLVGSGTRRSYIYPNDVIIVDRDSPAESGDLVVARKEDTVVLGQLLKETDGTNRIATDSELLSGYTDMALVVEIHHRLKT